ncbi:NTP transferase domain-containing protein [Streptomyces sp. NPDC004111]|uniref:NTP transferase domain-containing protein n=1 Tax=Streptomyces sp. NPDC004111 TaxID=3364690 RepID=UPI003678A79C
MSAKSAPGSDAYDAVVLAGGAGRRLGGVDKAAVPVGGRPLLDRVLTACGGAGTTVVVGGRRATARPVTWTREEPPGGGPLAALGAGARETGADLVVVLSVDLPFVDRATVSALVRALDTAEDAHQVEGAMLVDAGGRDQPLVAVYRAEPLRRELALLETEYGTLAGLPLRLLTAELDLVRVTAAAPTASFDCDTWEDIATARARIREHGHVLDEWITAVKDELDVDVDVDIPLLLDLARDAAHGIARPAAPLTTFLVGYAAGRAGGEGPEAVAEAVRKATALAARWVAESQQAGTPPGEAPSGAGPDDSPGTTEAGPS